MTASEECPELCADRRRDFGEAGETGYIEHVLMCSSENNKVGVFNAGKMHHNSRRDSATTVQL